MNPQTLLECFRYKVLTICTHAMFFIKITIISMVSCLLGLIVAAGQVQDFTPMRKAYIALTLIIIFCLILDFHLRNNFSMFDMIKTIFGSINLAIPLEKRMKKSKIRFVIQICSLLLLDIVKILAAVYCIIALYVENIENVFVNYCLLALVLFESLIGVILYICYIILSSLEKDFMVSWLTWMGNWHLRTIVHCLVYPEGDNIVMKFIPIIRENTNDLDDPKE